MEEVVAARPSPDPSFWSGRSVLLTGHTGFKGTWAAIWLNRLGARVTGFSLAPDSTLSLWGEVGEGLLEQEIIADLADRAAVSRAIAAAQPSLVLHMAAQALVRTSYAQPVETFATNVMGTVHLLEALRQSRMVGAVLVVTTDKVYANDDSDRHFRESDALGGRDPYSASKAAAELATASYAASFLGAAGVRVATARAGNVLGGGDWSRDRLVPDIWRAAKRGEPVALRNPQATRPWQHVLDSLAGYLAYLEALTQGTDVPAALNFGPDPGERVTVAEIAELMGKVVPGSARWRNDHQPAPHEMQKLSLDPSQAAAAIGWRTKLSPRQAAEWTADWYAAWDRGEDALGLCQTQLERFEAL